MKFLIIKTSSLGDIIHAFSALSFLRKKFPDSRIDWVVEEPFAPLVRAHPEIDNVYTISTKKWRRGSELKKIFYFLRQLRAQKYDIIFDLQSNIKSTCVLACARSKKKVGFGRRSVHEWPNLFFTNCKFDPPKGINIRQDCLYIVQSALADHTPFDGHEVLLKISLQDQKAIENLFHSLPPGEKVLVAPGAAWENKQLSFEGMVSILKKRSSFFLFSWGSEAEKKLSQRLHEAFPQNSILLDRYSLPVLQNIMSRVDLVIAMDSLPLHLCGTTKTPSLSFFGPTRGEKFIPLGKQHTFVQGTCPYNMTFEKRCPKMRTCKTAECIKNIR